MLLAQIAMRSAAVSAGNPDDGDANRFILANPAMFEGRELLTLERVRFTPASALTDAEIEAVKTMADARSLLARKGVPVQQATASVGTSELPPELAARIVKLRIGEAFFMSEGPQGYFATIMERTKAPLPEPQQIARARAILRDQAMEAAAKEELATARRTASISYKKGYAQPRPLPQKPKG